MNKGFLFVFLVFAGIFVIAAHEALEPEIPYREFRLSDNGTCEIYYNACACKGDLMVMESYPPQYSCSGKKTCVPINETVCR